jgi:hypothetical protein
VDEKQPQVISSKVSADEAEIIKGRAAARGISVSEYLRERALSKPTEASIEHLETLIKHCIYSTNRLHIGLYSIAEAEGKAGRPLTNAELREVYDRARAEALQYAVKFPDNFAAMQAEIAAMSKKQEA